MAKAKSDDVRHRIKKGVDDATNAGAEPHGYAVLQRDRKREVLKTRRKKEPTVAGWPWSMLPMWLKLQQTPMDIWRTCFFALMAWEWLSLHHGPMTLWERVFTFYHTSLAGELAAVQPLSAALLTYGGVLLALASIKYDKATIGFAMLYIHYMFTAITNFTNHDYLFMLLSTLMALWANASNRDVQRAWLEAMRGQIVVVYAFASLWKLHPEWMDGTIVKGIFLSFQEQGVARGIPWQALYRSFPGIFQFIALSGLGLDATLFICLLFLPPGHLLQSVTLIFHAFTAVTMSQRIGYAFPMSMVLSSLLFQPGFQPTDGKVEVPHARWLARQLRRRTYPGALAWLALQWAMPLRMPIISGNEFKYTAEGYRWSWTMMLHSKSSFITPGMYFMDVYVAPGSLEDDILQPFSNPQAFPYTPLIGPRGTAALLVFPRQLPMVANTVRDLIQPYCPSKKVTVRATVYSSSNDGPYIRLVDPTVDLAAVHDALKQRTSLAMLWGTLWDKPPPHSEFLLRGLNQRGQGSLPQDQIDAKLSTIIDRSPCLFESPLRFFHVTIQVWLIRSPAPMNMVVCEDAEEKSCVSHQLIPGHPDPIDSGRTHRTFCIGWEVAGKIHEKFDKAEVDKVFSNPNMAQWQPPPGATCANSEEDVEIRIRLRKSLDYRP